ncbi:MAG: tRNA pseudouridine(55) synthase TruB [Lachnospiraceae bacterium]|nr:tRNA pseudouridine(55) synthase TruB [Lachnospiraceae bacterium]
MSYDGILIINKEKGYTSNDVVSVLRGILKMKKIGHTGTLDPEATGVLPVCIGKATKTVGLITERDKEYSAVARLGVTTDTEDMTGRVLSRTDIPEGSEPGLEAVKEAFLSFKGKYEQIPPMYSAKKVNGRKLYELAREGVTIERKPCTVEIKDIVIKGYDFPLVSLSVSCGKGTYIRSLIRDAGERLGTGAAMESLERIRVSEYSIKDALTLKEVEELVFKGEIEGYIKSTESLFSSLPSITVRGRAEALLKNGNSFSVPETFNNGEYRVHFSDGAFAAVYSIKNGQAKPVKMFL